MPVINVPAPQIYPGISGAIGQASMNLVQGWLGGMQQKWQTQMFGQDIKNIQNYITGITAGQTPSQPQVSTPAGQQILSNVMLNLMTRQTGMEQIMAEGYTPEQAREIQDIRYGLRPGAGQPKTTSQIQQLEQSADERLNSILLTYPDAVTEIKNPAYPDEPGIKAIKPDYRPTPEQAKDLRDSVIEWSNNISAVSGIEPERLQKIGFDVLNRKVPSMRIKTAAPTEKAMAEGQQNLWDLLEIGKEWLEPESRPETRPIPAAAPPSRPGLLERGVRRFIPGAESENKINRSMYAITQQKLPRDVKNRIMRLIATKQPIRVKSPEGQTGSIPPEDVADALEQGYTLVQ